MSGMASCRRHIYPFLRLPWVLTTRFLRGKHRRCRSFFDAMHKALMKSIVTGYSSPFFGESRRSELQETDELEPNPPKRFFNAFKKKDTIDGATSKAATPNIFHRNSASKDSNSQVGMWCCVTFIVFTLTWCGRTRVIILPFLIP